MLAERLKAKQEYSEDLVSFSPFIFSLPPSTLVCRGRYDPHWLFAYGTDIATRRNVVMTPSLLSPTSSSCLYLEWIRIVFVA